MAINFADKKAIVGHVNVFCPAPDTSKELTTAKVIACAGVVIGILALVALLIATGTPIEGKTIYHVLQATSIVSFIIAGIAWFVYTGNEGHPPGQGIEKRVALTIEDLELYLQEGQYIYVNQNGKGGWVGNDRTGIKNCEGREDEGPELKGKFEVITLKQLYDQKEAARGLALAHKAKVGALS